MSQMDNAASTEDFVKVVSIIHESCMVALGTEEYHAILGFCKTLDSPRKMAQPRHALDSIHLCPRVLTLPDSLGLTVTSDSLDSDSYAIVKYVEGNSAKTLLVMEDGSTPIDEIRYILNLEDAYPSSGGLIAQGKSVVLRALRFIGLALDDGVTFEGILSKNSSLMNNAEEAVLERLKLGELEIISNSLIGSPQHVESLTKSGRILFLPDFNHLGLGAHFLVHGDYDSVVRASRENAIEATIFRTGEQAYAVVCSPSTWRAGFVASTLVANLELWPVLETSSPRRMLRDEPLKLI